MQHFNFEIQWQRPRRRNKREKFQYRKKFGFHHQKLEMLRQMQLFRRPARFSLRRTREDDNLSHFLSAFEPFSPPFVPKKDS
jgi:hypothetical protein